MNLFLSDFCLIRPPYEYTQQELLAWLAAAHIYAETKHSGKECPVFTAKIEEQFKRIGKGMDKIIDKRGSYLSDVQHKRWDEMEIYQLDKKPEGSCFGEKTLFYERATAQIFEQFYPENHPLPEHLIHVTCTGYTSPSAAQRLVSLRQAGQAITVTHAYHMGCYASFPAIRIAKGIAPADIVHTELCSLHMNPLLHEMEQLIVHSLFADGAIKYTVTPEKKESSLHLLAQHEELIPSSTECMSWRCEGWGLRMTLSKEVPVLIGRALLPFLEKLAKIAHLDIREIMGEALFAVHPGGPKILQQMEKILGLQPEQLHPSYAILQSYGNMSSATLPHIWERILHDPRVPRGAKIASLAYGPGLTLTGALFQKE